MNNFFEESDTSAKSYSAKFKLLYIILGLSAFVILARLWYLQVLTGKQLRIYSEKNRIKETKIPAPRGLLLDREGKILVENLPGFEATIIPQYAIKLTETANELGPVLDLPPKEIVNIVKTSRRKNGPFRPVRIKENLNLDEVYRLKLLKYDHPGLNISQSIIRHYPLNESGAQLFGYVGEISKKKIGQYNKKYKGKIRFEQGDIVGQSGLETVWEEIVRGKDGISFVEVDARGRIADTESHGFFQLNEIDAIPGENLILTIDKDIQLAAKAAMNREDKVGPRVGSLVAMKANGEILAWISSPSFDPNEFSTGISTNLWASLLNDPFKPLRNKVIQDHYPPGSTFKPIMALASLQEKIITPNTLVNAPGVLRFGRRLYHDSHRGGHGNINVVQAIEASSNIFFYKMGIQLGIDRMSKYATLLGIGKKTNVNVTNEMPGLMPTKAWKKRRIGEAWQPGENLSTAIGQGFVLTTALQMAVAYNAIGLEGKVYRPFVIKKIIGHDNKKLKEFNPILVRDVTQPNDNGDFIDKKYFKYVKEGMRRVSHGDRGTARWYRIPGVEMAGKTGTSQVVSSSADKIYDKCQDKPIKQRHHAWFVGYAPADKPEITVAVLAEHACSGSSGGAPVVRDTLQAYFEKFHPELVEKGKEKLRQQWRRALAQKKKEKEEGSTEQKQEIRNDGDH